MNKDWYELSTTEQNLVRSLQAAARAADKPAANEFVSMLASLTGLSAEQVTAMVIDEHDIAEDRYDASVVALGEQFGLGELLAPLIGAGESALGRVARKLLDLRDHEFVAELGEALDRAGDDDARAALIIMRRAIRGPGAWSPNGPQLVAAYRRALAAHDALDTRNLSNGALAALDDFRIDQLN
jgi:hypothetical protein